MLMKFVCGRKNDFLLNFTNANFSDKHFKTLFGDENINESSFSLNAYEVCVWKEE